MLADRRFLVGAVAAVVVVVAAAVVVPRVLGDDGPDPAPDAQAFLDAWSAGDTEAMAAHVVDPPDSFAEDLATLTDGLAATSTGYELGTVESDGDEATATYEATVALGGLGEWSYEGTLTLHRTGDGGDEAPAWAVAWSPSAVHPDLADGQRLTRTRDWPERAVITGADGEPLAEARPAVTVGMVPERVEDLDAVKAALRDQLGVDPAEVDAARGAPGVEPSHFVAIVTVPQERYEAAREVIYPVPGLSFRETTSRAGPSEGFAQHVLGSTGEVTAERLDELGGPYQAGDQVGVTGLEAVYERRLAGTPSGEVQIVDGDGEVVTTLATIAGTAPQPVATTLDPQVQAAVESAAAGVTTPAAIVAVDAAGNVRGAASRPLREPFNRAFAGAYPPGSTFKIVTTEGLLTAGTTPETPVECPPTADIGGRSITNFEDSSLGLVPFARAFVESCNTAFVTAVRDVPTEGLVAAAERFGFNAEYTVGLSTEGGSYPTPEDATERAVAAIGQGRVTASPLHMATVAGTVIDGTWEPPTLLPDEPGEDRPAPTELDAGHRATIDGLMHRVVAEGSGSSAAVPGRDLAGKTGTAEFGTGDPLPTHAWFVGFSGDLAAAVFLEDGGVGGQDAAPVASQLFAALP